MCLYLNPNKLLKPTNTLQTRILTFKTSITDESQQTVSVSQRYCKSNSFQYISQLCNCLSLITEFMFVEKPKRCYWTRAGVV